MCIVGVLFLPQLTTFLKEASLLEFDEFMIFSNLKNIL